MNISVLAMKRGGGSQATQEQCAICLEEETTGNDLQALTCGQTFHAECLGRYIQSAYGSVNTNFDQLRCPNFSSHGLACAGVLTRDEIDQFTSLSASSSSSSAGAPGNAAILAFYDERVAKRANPRAIVRISPDTAELVEIAAGNLQICPDCDGRAHRLDGCNHMTCSIDEGGCGMEYCYPCGTGYNPTIDGGIGWGARACACPHWPGDESEPIPLADGYGGALPQFNPAALRNSAALGDLFTVRALLAMPQADVNIQNARSWTALHLAARAGNLEVVRELLLVGANVNIQENEGFTALHLAADAGHLAIVQALLAAHGIQVNTPDNQGRTALHWAANQGHLAVVQALLAAHGIQVNTPDNQGYTALQWTAENGHLELVQALLTAPDILVNTQNAHIWTALHSAASKGRLEVVTALLAAPGILVNTQDNLGDTARDKAVGNGHAAIVTAIDAHIAAHN